MNEKLINANIKLVDEMKILKRDIMTLIKYIQGSENKSEVEEIIRYYSIPEYSRQETERRV